MKQKEIIIITDKNGFFGQTRKPWVPINLNLLIEELHSQNIQTLKYTFDEVSLNINQFKDKLIFYTFSQKSQTRDFIKSIIFHLQKNNTIIPNYDMLLIHENKGYQELLKKNLDVTSLNSYYLNDLKSIEEIEISYPIVFKTPDGSNGDGVFLCKNKNDIYLNYNRINKLNLKVKLDLFRRNYLRTEKKFDYYPNYDNKIDFTQFKQHSQNYAPFILQEFVPNLKYDYRLLILFDKYYIMKRLTKENDFRASGSKKFVTEVEINPKILNFAEMIYNKFDSPFLSIDLVESENNYHLIEYQALHFGVSAFIRNKYCYQKNDSNWQKLENNSKLEVEMAIALSKHIDKKWYSQN